MGSLQHSLRLLAMMILLGLLLLLNLLQAVPISRTLDLADQRNYTVVDEIEDQMIEEDKWEQGIDEQIFHGRMDFESNDYPGSGANNRHDPGGGYKTPGKNGPPN